MKALTFTSDDKRRARLAGFKKKAPKKPKGKSENSLEGYLSRYNDWVKEMKSKAGEGKKLDDLRDQVRKAKR